MKYGGIQEVRPGGEEVVPGGRFLLCHLISLTSELNDEIIKK